MLSEGAAAPEMESNNGNETMDEELANDQSIEAKIEREVLRVTRIVEKKMDNKLEKSKDHSIKLLKNLQSKSDEEMNERAD